MTFGSLFSGIGGFDLGFTRAGMTAAWQIECEQNCNRVLAKHWPDVRRYDDVRTFHATSDAVRPRLICGGFPCQDLSVAGRRAGLAGERSGLFFEFMRIVGELSPAWVVIENVPGLLSSNGGRDMGIVLGALAKLGYGFAYRILDAQWFGVPQRRRRVFIVGCFGDWRRAAEVLFERESLPWDSPPSRQAGSRASRCIARGTGSSGYRYDANGEDFVTGSLQSHSARHGHAMTTQQAAECGQIVAATLNSGGNDGGLRTEPGEHLVAATLTSRHTERGHGAAGPRVEDIPNLVPIDMRQASRGEKLTNNRTQGSGGPPGSGVGDSGDPAFTVSERGQAIAYQCHGTNVGPMGAIRSGNGNETGGVPFMFQTRIARNGRGQPKEITDALTSCEGGTHADSKPHVAGAFGVRRLTPVECSRLQGFPDDWLDVEGLSDSARYRALGNAVAVPVAEWIGNRIVRVLGGEKS